MDFLEKIDNWILTYAAYPGLAVTSTGIFLGTIIFPWICKKIKEKIND